LGSLNAPENLRTFAIFGAFQMASAGFFLK